MISIVVLPVWYVIINSSFFSGTDAAGSEHSDNLDEAQSASSTDLPEGDLSFTVGVTESTPYPCQFCVKAFPRLSYLKKHEQVSKNFHIN